MPLTHFGCRHGILQDELVPIRQSELQDESRNPSLNASVGILDAAPVHGEPFRVTPYQSTGHAFVGMAVCC